MPDNGRLLIGVGNPHRGDDAAGWILADRLEAVCGHDFSIVRSDGDVGALLDWFATYPEVILVDAMDRAMITTEEQVFRWDATREPIPSGLSGTSSHVLGVAQAIELARALNQLPKRLIVFGIPGRDFQMKQGLSPETERLLPHAVEQVLKEITHA